MQDHHPADIKNQAFERLTFFKSFIPQRFGRHSEEHSFQVGKKRQGCTFYDKNHYHSVMLLGQHVQDKVIIFS